MSREIDVKALVSHLVRGDGADKCRICLGDTSEGQVYLGDTVMMDGEKPVTLAELLEVITGVEVDLAPALPAAACAACVTSATLAAPFVSLCLASNQKWHQITEHLSEVVPTPKQTKFVFIGDYIETGFVPTPCKTTRQALNILNNVPKRKRNSFKKLSINANCPDCGKHFTSMHYMNKHLRVLGKAMCPHCKEILPFGSFEAHARQHGIELCMCKRCNMVFRSKSYFTLHKCVKKGNRECVVCSKRFQSESKLVTHIALTHNCHICESCGKKFVGRNCFRYHSQKCANSKRAIHTKYTCDYCGKSYAVKNSLRVHIRVVHVFGKEYICEQCGKTFSNPSHLIEHDNTHNKVVDRYVCGLCGGKYSTRRGYERHYKRHFDVNGVRIPPGEPLRVDARVPRDGIIKPRRVVRLLCVVCGYSTRRKKDLIRHNAMKHNIMEFAETPQ